METKENFTTRANNLYNELRELGEEARDIITGFAKQYGEYTFDIENDDHIWVGEENYATALKFEHGNVLVFNSGCYSEYLHDMDDYNILDLATHILNL